MLPVFGDNIEEDPGHIGWQKHGHSALQGLPKISGISQVIAHQQTMHQKRCSVGRTMTTLRVNAPQVFDMRMQRYHVESVLVVLQLPGEHMQRVEMVAIMLIIAIHAGSHRSNLLCNCMTVSWFHHRVNVPEHHRSKCRQTCWHHAPPKPHAVYVGNTYARPFFRKAQGDIRCRQSKAQFREFLVGVVAFAHVQPGRNMQIWLGFQRTRQQIVCLPFGQIHTRRLPS